MKGHLVHFAKDTTHTARLPAKKKMLLNMNRKGHLVHLAIDLEHTAKFAVK